jgi:hypothetical protein
MKAVSNANAGTGRVIYYVNGIRTTWQGHCDTLKAIGKATCSKVIGIYNATNGATRDLGESAADTKNVTRNRIRTYWGYDTRYVGENPTVRPLAALIKAEVASGLRPEVWAHSQGGLITSLALAHARNTLKAARGLDIDRVTVKSFASAAPWWPSGPRYTHFIHTNDLVPVNLGLGRRGNYSLAGKGARIYRFNGEPGEFEDKPKGVWASIPYMTSYHDMMKVYLRYYKSKFGDCSQRKRYGKRTPTFKALPVTGYGKSMGAGATGSW